jgi:hypothetical protein
MYPLVRSIQCLKFEHMRYWVQGALTFVKRYWPPVQLPTPLGGKSLACTANIAPFRLGLVIIALKSAIILIATTIRKGR